MIGIARIAAWAALASVVALTFVPPALRPVSYLPHAWEHFAAFSALGAVFAFGYPRQRLAVILAAVPVTAVLEVVQLFAPGRHARLSDFVVNTLGACIGLAMVGWMAPQEKPRTGK
jgi:VanZ family protein